MPPTVTLPRPLEHQVPVLNSPARNKVVVCGRRWGKSALGLVAVVGGHGPRGRFRGAGQGANGYWVAPTYGIASEIWRDLKATPTSQAQDAIAAAKANG